MASTKFAWTLEATKTLIFEYESFEFLYNSQHEDYKNRNKRLDAYEEISKVISSGCTRMDVKRKLNGLRSQYLAEKMKIANSVRSGADADTIYKPTVYWFTLLKFLDESTSADKSDSNLEVPSQNQDANPEENEMSVIDANDSIQAGENTDPKLISTSNKVHKQKRPKHDNIDSLLQEASSTMTKMAKLATKPKVVSCEDDEDIFGKFVSSELKNIRKASDDRFARQTKRKIQSLLMSAWDTIDSIETISPSDASCSNSGYSSHWSGPVNQKFSQPCTIEIVDTVFDSSTSNSTQSSHWTSPVTIDPINEAMRLANVYEDS